MQRPAPLPPKPQPRSHHNLPGLLCILHNLPIKTLQPPFPFPTLLGICNRPHNSQLAEITVLRRQCPCHQITHPRTRYILRNIKQQRIDMNHILPGRSLGLVVVHHNHLKSVSQVFPNPFQLPRPQIQDNHKLRLFFPQRPDYRFLQLAHKRVVEPLPPAGQRLQEDCGRRYAVRIIVRYHPQRPIIRPYRLARPARFQNQLFQVLQHRLTFIRAHSYAP